MDLEGGLEKIKGLTDIQVEKKRRQFGFNELPHSKKDGLIHTIITVVREPMFLLLVMSGCLYFFLGDPQEGIILMSFVVFVIGITTYQERKTEKALEALRNLSSPRAWVIRNGEKIKISGREVVPGDILVLTEGDRIPADAKIIADNNLSIDESILTGESEPVTKTVYKKDPKNTHPGGPGLPFIYSGTMIVRGNGLAEVTATGSGTEFGKIGKALETIKTENTLLQKETNLFVGKMAIIGIAISLIVVIVYGLTRGMWIKAVLAGITLAMAILPEEFPMVLTIFLALGAWRISKKGVLTRRVPVVETLGSATILCVDKTGTLTLNQMTVREIYSNNKFCRVDFTKASDFPEEFHMTIEYSMLASQRDPFDPMEKAFKRLGEHYLSGTEHIHRDWQLVQEYPLSKELLALSRVWKSPNGKDYVIATKGAPEAIIDLCHLSSVDKKKLETVIETLSAKGLRLIAVARSRFTKTTLPKDQHAFDFEFLGLVGLEDPVRATVPLAIKECRSAGIKVVMITGDYPGTAVHIGREIGLNTDRVITGPMLNQMSDEELNKEIHDVSIFARVVPEQKLRIVNAFKSNHEVVAMTGDGVNDAPALKAAEIGIAMGGRGTDVAREASALVLLNDEFTSIVQSVKMGRRIFDNIKKAMAYILSIHVPIAGLSLIPVLMRWPLILMPTHVVFLELIIDPVCSVVFENEPEEDNVMKRPPRNPEEKLFNTGRLTLGLLQGFSVLVMTTAIYYFSLRYFNDEFKARTITFVTLIIANLALIFTNRSWNKTVLSSFRIPNKALWLVTGLTLVFLMTGVYLPFLQSVLQFKALTLTELAVGVGLGLLSIVWFEAFKFLHQLSLTKSVQKHLSK